MLCEDISSLLKGRCTIEQKGVVDVVVVQELEVDAVLPGNVSHIRILA